MRKGLRQLVVLGSMVAITSIYMNGTRLLSPTDLNSTYLTNLRYEGAGSAWNQGLFGENGRWASMENYIRTVREYDYRKNYGLLNQHDERRYHETFQNLARSALSEWESNRIGAARNALQEQADLIPTWYEIRTSKSPPIVIMGILAAAYSGHTLRYRLTENSTIESRSTMTSSHLDNQYFGWSNALLGASVGSTFDGIDLGVSIRKEIVAGVTVNFEQAVDRAIGMTYTAGF
jgi:hypothetical protein